MIPVQTTAISRRRRPHGGRGVSTDGRRVQDAPHRMEMELDTDDNDEEYVFYSLPPQRLAQKRKAHDLMAAVDSNQAKVVTLYVSIVDFKISNNKISMLGFSNAIIIWL